MARNFRYKNCTVCGAKYKPTSGVQKYCKACSYKQSKLVQAQAKHKWYETHKKDNKPTQEAKNVKALYDEDISSLIKAVYRINSIWCAISVIAMIIAIIAIVL